MSLKDKLDTLLKWFEANEIKWDNKCLEIRIVNDSYGVFAKKDLKNKNPIVKIPKECILSPKSTGIANILDDENIEGGCSLAISVMYEISQGKDSPWYGYLQALPRSEDLPIFWDSEKDILKGTEMEHAISNDLNDLKDDYADIVLPLLEKYSYVFSNYCDEYFSFDAFCRASTLVSSRSFEVDAFHGNAMVPFADVFNHRSGNNEHVHFETDFDVCDACGALDYCEHQYLEDLEQGSDMENDEDGWLDENGETSEPNDDDIEELDEEDEEGSLADLEELEESGVNFWTEEEKEKKDTCDMVLSRPVRKGEEIFNTYGDHPNIALLGKYGFCHDNNPNDYISVSEDAVVEACIALTKEILRAECKDIDDDVLEEKAIEKTRPRWEYFLMNEHILCPSGHDDDEKGDYEESDSEENGCCSGDDCCVDENGEEKGCCGDKHEHDGDGDACETEDVQRSRPYFINVEGLYEDTLTCLLHIMFVDNTLFETFVDNVEAALKYLEELANGARTESDVEVKKRVYQLCLALSEHRRLDYFGNKQSWIPIEDDVAAREKAKTNREIYALTCRINEKKIVEKSIAYYKSMIESCTIRKRPIKKKSKKIRR
ncbi:hypothetical protein EC973_004982 [Apophysomyces ossiformis]|uniref:Ribosomal lysine N-methyltransferase 3 n=1 Tax=Apophysomyces ossiformis TaxID=679940 RepID=A0A8H7BJL6_9FUNG|nr:hypothetical protein EC973_004982 [Apophysomyces ossiformis]